MLFHLFSIKNKRKISALVGWSLLRKHPSHHHRHHHLPIWLLEFSVLLGQSDLNHKKKKKIHRHLLLFTLRIHIFSTHNASINIPGIITGHLWGPRCSGNPQDRPQKCGQPGGSPRCPIGLLQHDCVKGPDFQSTARCADMRHVQGTDACQ